MAGEATITASAVRTVAGNADEVFDAYAAAGYTPEMGNVVALCGDDEVDLCDATLVNGLELPAGMVEAVKAVPGAAGGVAHKVTVRGRGIVEGFTDLRGGTVLYTSPTPGKFHLTDPTDSGIQGFPIALVKSATRVILNMPVLG